MHPDFDDYDDIEDESDQPSLVECKYCGKGKLEWFELEEGTWRLLERSGKVHTCLPKKIKLSLDTTI